MYYGYVIYPMLAVNYPLLMDDTHFVNFLGYLNWIKLVIIIYIKREAPWKRFFNNQCNSFV